MIFLFCTEPGFEHMKTHFELVKHIQFNVHQLLGFVYIMQQGFLNAMCDICRILAPLQQNIIAFKGSLNYEYLSKSFEKICFMGTCFVLKNSLFYHRQSLQVNSASIIYENSPSTC